MKISNEIEELYLKVYGFVEKVPVVLTPYIRRLIRLCALPYYFFFVIDWSKCDKSKLAVISDLAYIFFCLKYYPDNYMLCKLWQIDRRDWKFYYGSIYDPYQRMKLNREVQKKEYKVVFNDKEVCYELCKSKNIPLPTQFCCLDPDDNYVKILDKIFCENAIDKVIIKPCIGSGGHGILLAYKQNGIVMLRDANKLFKLEDMKLQVRSVVQAYMKQHELLENIASSFNTVRIVTLLTKNKETIIVGALARFGIGDAYVDNTSSGGVAIGIDIENGRLKKIGHDFNSNEYLFHPTSKVVFENVELPYWNELVELAKDIQKGFSFYKMLGLDIGITNEGPILIEINPLHDNVGLEQSYGPILLNDKVKNSFMEYDLLINDALI
ncbi:hypothetical protein KI809_00210 [Geobacter pelophilus]|uniref:ATP-grasp domain-containing protein n=1 Tax=Geoanaerobacter pelophilus TaxID=60036 RepID=A0AAW4KZL9_9BACT|nr:sugar-transfer associated ATP-grasp domain-containing protein [Geoanaerobacter pelophilus]MBT0662712.1 hypothetical protein [Geoanaerobacter pelophilus]